MNLRRYEIFGVCFAADVTLDLPEADRDQKARFELCAMAGPWPAKAAGPVLEQDGDDWVRLRVYSDGSVELEWQDWLSFWIDPLGNSVRYRVADHKYPNAFSAYVGNFAVSASLLMQGEELLHSTVVRYRDAGLGLLGPSGAGKSTLTAHLLGLGAELVTDDMLRITERGGVMYAEPGQPRLKLFEEAAKHHLPQAIGKGRWNPFSEKFLFEIATHRESRVRQRLDALILLAPPHEVHLQEVILRRLEGLELFHTLTSSTMNYRLQTADRLARQFAFASRLAERLPTYALHYPRRHDIFPAVVRSFEDLVSSKCVGH